MRRDTMRRDRNYRICINLVCASHSLWSVRGIDARQNFGVQLPTRSFGGIPYELNSPRVSIIAQAAGLWLSGHCLITRAAHSSTPHCSLTTTLSKAVVAWPIRVEKWKSTTKMAKRDSLLRTSDKICTLAFPPGELCR